MSEVKTIVLRVGMHCEGCARKVKKSLCSLSGLEELKVEYKAQKVTVKGAIDQKQVLEKLSHIGKSGEILQVIVEPVKPKEEKEKKEAPKAAQAPPPQIQTVVLKAMLHCEGCGRKVKDAIKKVPGVQDINVNYKEQKVIVKGFVDANKVLQKALKSGKYVELCPPEKPKDVAKESKGATDEKKDAPKGEDKKEASKGDGKDTSKEEKQAPKEDKKDDSKGGKKDAPKEDKKDAKDAPKDNKKDEPKEASKDAPKEEKKDAPKGDKKENVKEGNKDASKEDKVKQKDEKDTLKDEKKDSKDEKKEVPKAVVEEVASPYIVYRFDAPQLFSEDNPNACTIM
ncbi:hypothetical protein O6H91_23G036400 [Diphasiastrum complanatum]|uniref:Uncharacterized protein n=3 Tax=Diphasiastrum complanatum TaxID=34168 RepID=A0ACC2A9P7_DIPCM|nr:hypothetical protein O6H91_23G036400 [Diphasiastrum complanatum]KAJ7514274.1 hypothetical protein O6H91_23G036400 [Diphasiastrum complanatum]KAJ7514276.1 hypothetical protein O6H91_23G036400 [Diphasiastrum complanatum]